MSKRSDAFFGAALCRPRTPCGAALNPRYGTRVRIVSYRSERGLRAGVLRGNTVVDAWDRIAAVMPEIPPLGDRPPSVRELIRLGISELPELDEHSRLPVDQVSLGPPVPDPDKIICIGLNYRSHAAEAGLDPPAMPTFFAKFRNALVPSGSVVIPPTPKLDYEAELAFAIGRECQAVNEEEALDYVAGYMLLNDLSARDLQFATPQWMPGKVFDGSAPCGPALVTPDEAGPHDAIEFELTLNGETMQSASSADLIFSVPQLVARLSKLLTLEPGDIVSTGTPAGVGSVRTPRVWLQPGDEVVISSPTLGTLETTIAGS
jgi:2-keto-4-pentenoate hydratase/2-oxohepta-3-ene-1,7-dioic acid hydratase in catechol pathway